MKVTEQLSRVRDFILSVSAVGESELKGGSPELLRHQSQVESNWFVCVPVVSPRVFCPGQGGFSWGTLKAQTGSLTK